MPLFDPRPISVPPPAGFNAAAPEPQSRLHVISKAEAYEHSMEMINSWEPSSQSWSLRNGFFLPVAATAIPPIMIVNKLRAMHKVTGPITLPFLVARFVPMTMGALSSYGLVRLSIKNLVLEEYDCPICLELRAVSMQMLAGVAVPSALAFLNGYGALHTMCVRGVPRNILTYDGLAWSRKVLSRCSGIIGGNMAGQAALMSALIYMQSRQWREMNHELEKRISEDEKRKESQPKKKDESE